MVQTGQMTPVTAPAWIPDEDAVEGDEVVLTTAELAECTCPDPCDCDHDY